jgi:hypothetical protein
VVTKPPAKNPPDISNSKPIASVPKPDDNTPPAPRRPLIVFPK